MQARQPLEPQTLTRNGLDRHGLADIDSADAFTAEEPISSQAYRDVLGRFGSGVTIVTMREDNKRHGLTVSAFSSLSADPPMVAVTIDRKHTAHQILAKSGAAFGVNLLAQDQQALSDRFAWVKDQDRFAEGSWQDGVTGSPLLQDALAWLDCRVRYRLEVGSHSIFVGLAVASYFDADPLREPLLYWNRAYRKICEPVGEPA